MPPSSLLTGAYLYDLTIHRPDLLSTLHHCMGPALLLWIRTSFATFSPEDAMGCRPLMVFVFFGASVGGTAASAASFLLRVGRRYLEPRRLYACFASCLAVLTASTVLSCFLSLLYIAVRFRELFAAFGLALALPGLWEAFECYLQWRWLFKFYELERKFWEQGDGADNNSHDNNNKTAPPVLPPSSIPVAKAKGSSAFPHGTEPALKGLAAVWTAVLAGVFVQLGTEAYKIYGGTGSDLLLSVSFSNGSALSPSAASDVWAS